MELKKYSADNVQEVAMKFHKGKYLYLKKSEQGKPAFERCVEVPWIIDKIKQINPQPNSSLFDFGCNKAKYILDLKQQYELKTFGIDMKPKAKNFVDIFFHGEYDDRLQRAISKHGPYQIVTAISAVEHAGHMMHPEEVAIRRYQLEICKFLITSSESFFLSVPFGSRPGWAKDKSRRNLYQFNDEMIHQIENIAKGCKKNTMVEIYKLRDEHWCQSSMEKSSSSRYRDAKSGASAIALVSVY